MKILKTILITTLVYSPTISIAHGFHEERSPRYEQRWPDHPQPPYSDYYEYDSYDRRDPHHEYQRHQRNKNKHKARKIIKSGWDVDPRVAKRASNCHRYTLSTQGGKGSARITSISGKNYIQVNGQKSGYVCFQGNPTLELGKLANPNIKVTFNLEGSGSYGFGRGNKGSNYKNHWYRSYWGL